MHLKFSCLLYAYLIKAQVHSFKVICHKRRNQLDYLTFPTQDGQIYEHIVAPTFIFCKNETRLVYQPNPLGIFSNHFNFFNSDSSVFGQNFLIF